MLKPLYLVAHTGVPNYGDELIPKAWLDYLTAKFPDRKIYVDTRFPGNATNILGQYYRNVQFTDTIYQLVERLNNAGKDLNRADDMIQSWLKDGGTPKYDIGLDILKTVESIHFVGGGYINGSIRTFRGHLKALLIARELKKMQPELKIFATGLGIYPVGDHLQDKLNQIIDDFDFFEVRDEESASISHGMLGVDDMFLQFADQHPGINYNVEVPRVNILLQKDLQNPDKLVALLADVVGHIKQSAAISDDEPIAIVESISPNDGWVYRAIQDFDLPNPLVFYSAKDVLMKGFPNRPDSIWYTTRFHFHMIGAANGHKGTFFNTGGSYYDVKHGSLEKLETGWQNYNTSQSFTPTVNAHFPEIAKKLGNLKYALAEKLYQL